MILMGAAAAISSRSRSPVTSTSVWLSIAAARTHWSPGSRFGSAAGAAGFGATSCSRRNSSISLMAPGGKPICFLSTRPSSLSTTSLVTRRVRQAPRAGHPRTFPGLQRRGPRRSCLGKPSRDVASHILIRQVPARLSERQCSTSEPFKPQQAQLPPEGITNKLATGPTSLLAESVKKLFQGGVQPNGDGRSHLVRCTTHCHPRQCAVHGSVRP